MTQINSTDEDYKPAPLMYDVLSNPTGPPTTFEALHGAHLFEILKTVGPP